MNSVAAQSVRSPEVQAQGVARRNLMPRVEQVPALALGDEKTRPRGPRSGRDSRD